MTTAKSNILALNIGIAFNADKGHEYEAAPGGYLIELRYKAMVDPVTKVKKVPPNPFVVCAPVLELPSTQNSALDSILKTTMEGYTESLARKLRTEEKEADSIEFTGAAAAVLNEDGTEKDAAYDGDFGMTAIIEHAEEKASSLKLSESIISGWWKADGSDACTASYMAQYKITDAADAKVTQAVANMALLFLKLSAPVPDLGLEVCEVLVRRISIIESATSTTQAIRRKLEKRVAELTKARTLLANEGAI